MAQGATSVWKIAIGVVLGLLLAGGCGVGACVLLVGYGASSVERARQAAAKATPVPPGPTATPRATGNWNVSREKSKIDDSESVFLSVEADTEISGWLKKAKPSLWIRCQERKTEVAITTGMAANPEVGNYNHATVTVRIDGAAAFKVNAGESTDNEALFLGGTNRAKQLLGHKQLLVQFTPFKSDPQTTTFQIQGIDEAIKPLRKECGW